MNTDLEVLDTMTKYGGSFVNALALAWRRADPINAAKLHAAFPDIFTRYDDMTSVEKRQP